MRNEMSGIGGITVTAKLDRESGQMKVRVVVVRRDASDHRKIEIREIGRDRYVYCDAAVFFAELTFEREFDDGGNTVACTATYENCPAYEHVVLVCDGAVAALEKVERVT